ncbi:MAG: DUF2892 domain-containing protein [Gammaproteobacteria bacterium]|nr:DUF2892 domain-containing protein [Gammaproteobacteria bacterium]MDH5800115.1 DUF2892 domain-containing protein [Gammaproteobacteria bacterium]
MNNSDRVGNLSTVSRLVRVGAGATLIGVTMTTTATPLGWLALLPLLAIYPMFTAVTGWSPLKALLGSQGELSTPVRVVAATVGIAAIGSVYVVTAPLGNLAVLPLLGIYPVFAAIAGVEPLTALFSKTETEIVVEQSEELPEEQGTEEHYEVDYPHAA